MKIKRERERERVKERARESERVTERREKAEIVRTLALKPIVTFQGCATYTLP